MPGAQLSGERLVSESLRFTIYIQTKKTYHHCHHLILCLKKHWIREGETWAFFKGIFQDWTFKFPFLGEIAWENMLKQKAPIQVLSFFSQETTTQEGESLDVDWLLYRATVVVQLLCGAVVWSPCSQAVGMLRQSYRASPKCSTRCAERSLSSWVPRISGCLLWMGNGKEGIFMIVDFQVSIELKIPRCLKW